MRQLLATFLVIAAIVCIGCRSRSSEPSRTGPNPVPIDPKEMSQLKGTWQVIAIEAAGNPVPVDRVQKLNLQYIFEDGKLTVRRPDRPDNTNTFEVDSTASPKRITINMSPVLRGAYAIEGNKLRLCLMVDDNPNAGYPTALFSKPSPKTDLLTLERP
jgi:uncharacterized protein (TIGR03067 family)